MTRSDHTSATGTETEPQQQTKPAPPLPHSSPDPDPHAAQSDVERGDSVPAYLRYLCRLKCAWSDMPQLRVEYRDLSVTFAAPVGAAPDGAEGQSSSSSSSSSAYTIPTVVNQVAHYAKLPFALAARRVGLAAEPRRYALSGAVEHKRKIHKRKIYRILSNRTVGQLIQNRLCLIFLNNLCVLSMGGPCCRV